MEQNDESTDDRPTVRIPKYRRGDEVVAWSEVDAEWWEHVQHARVVQEKVVETYLHEPGVKYIERERGEETIGGHATETINILVADDETRARLDLPDEIEGIRITVEIGTISDTE
ncbi:hypothetical protein C457_10926 [Haloferax prahovense DSM 18310]|uniref:Uncharacterized protein n=1 Tax=Haloferax prahovense (strain DSM 18310 / JCM 13924 / TL6) TaxID=1227461 RepID=M0GDN3_HALPT|nr:hypothetical protein [Haloferax prahovense]ELZ68919.1 hypothetical protein C457_10926 [Haloferax prahovense DSM 18310]